MANFHHRMDALPLLISQVTTCTTPSSRVGDAHIDHHHLDRGVVSYAAPLLDDEWADFHSFAVDFGILDGDDTDDKEKEEADEDEFATMPPVPVGMHWATEVMSAERRIIAAA